MPDRTARAASRDGAGSNVTDLFRRTAAQRGFLADAAQEAALARLQRLQDEFVAYKARRRTKLQRLVVHPPLPLEGERHRREHCKKHAFFLRNPADFGSSTGTRPAAETDTDKNHPARADRPAASTRRDPTA